MTRPVPRPAILSLLWLLLGLLACAGRPGAAEIPELLRLQGHTDYRAWMERYGWEDLRPFSNSSKRFRIDDGALRMESQDDSYLIGSELKGLLPAALDDFPYLRFVVRIDRVPRRPEESLAELDDSAFRLYAALRDDPPQSIAYAWTWTHPAGHWSAQRSSLFGDFGGVRHKSLGRGAPPAGLWITVEANLREDVRSQFPDLAAPRLVGISLKADSNHTDDGNSLAWVRSASLHRESLRAEGRREGDALGDTVLWYR